MQKVTFYLNMVLVSLIASIKSSLILIHQFIPFFILCLDIIGNPERSDLETDLASVTWISDYVEKFVEQRSELRPVMVIMKAIMLACHQVKTNHLTSSMIGNS